MAERRVKFCGWGYEGEGLTPDEEKLVLGRYAERFGLEGFERVATPKPEEVALHTPRLELPERLTEICSTEHYDRLVHTYG
ncbi:MAG TPA: FAD-binding oxidoreductase, partial [Alphaproteobacteria bacterium]|nr:FAD-binding oxidoreductase [Alphaproteobacteria bacterium]